MALTPYRAAALRQMEHQPAVPMAPAASRFLTAAEDPQTYLDAAAEFGKGILRAPIYTAMLPLDLMDLMQELRDAPEDQRLGFTSGDVTDYWGLGGDDLTASGFLGELTGDALSGVGALKLLGKAGQKLKEGGTELADVFYQARRRPGLTEADPKYFGGNRATPQSERARYGRDGPVYAYRPDIEQAEPALAHYPERYNLTVPRAEVYDFDADPMRLRDLEGVTLADLENLVRSRGYKGYRVPEGWGPDYQRGSLRYFDKAPLDPADRAYMNWEATPQGRPDMPLDEQRALLAEAEAQVIDPEGRNVLLKPLRPDPGERGVSYWGGNRSVGRNEPVTLPRWREMPEEAMVDAADATNKLFDQQAVGWLYPRYGQDIEGVRGVELLPDRDLTDEEIWKLTEQMMERGNYSGGIRNPDTGGVSFLHFGETRNPETDLSVVANPIGGKVRSFVNAGPYVENKAALTEEAAALLNSLRKP